MAVEVKLKLGFLCVGGVGFIPFFIFNFQLLYHLGQYYKLLNRILSITFKNLNYKHFFQCRLHFLMCWEDSFSYTWKMFLFYYLRYNDAWFYSSYSRINLA